MKPVDSGARAGRGDEPDNTAPAIDVPDYRPVERFWPYVDLPEQPTDEELAALNPELSEALFGTPRLPFSVTLDFPPFEGATTHGRWRWLAPPPSIARPVAEPAFGTGRVSIRRLRSRCAICSRLSAGSMRAMY